MKRCLYRLIGNTSKARANFPFKEALTCCISKAAHAASESAWLPVCSGEESCSEGGNVEPVRGTVKNHILPKKHSRGHISAADRGSGVRRRERGKTEPRVQRSQEEPRAPIGRMKTSAMHSEGEKRARGERGASGARGTCCSTRSSLSPHSSSLLPAPSPPAPHRSYSPVKSTTRCKVAALSPQLHPCLRTVVASDTFTTSASSRARLTTPAPPPGGSTE